MSTSLIDEITQIAEAGELPPQGRPGALEPLTAPRKKKKKKRRKPVETELEPVQGQDTDPLTRETAPPTHETTTLTHNVAPLTHDTAPLTAADLTAETSLGIENAAYTSEVPLPTEETFQETHQEPEPKEKPILGIYIHRTDHITFSMRRVVVSVSLVDELTGCLLDKESPDRAAVSYYETAREKPITQILPVMSAPFVASREKSLLPEWEELIQINEPFDHIADQKRNGLFIFEVQDCPMGEPAKTVAWAYLRVANHVTGGTNLNRRLRLQLYQPVKSTQDSLKAMASAASSNKKKIRSTLHVTVSSLAPLENRPVDTDRPVARSTRPDQAEYGRAELGIAAEASVLSLPGTDTQMPEEFIEWKRTPGTPCRLPNAFHSRSVVGESSREFAGFCCSWSSNGVNLAWSSASQFEHRIIVERFPKGRRVAVAAHSGLIYDLSWSADSTQLAACSADQTATVWRLDNDQHLVRRATLYSPCYLYAVSRDGRQVMLFGLDTLSQQGQCFVYTEDESGEFLLTNESTVSMNGGLNSASITCDWKRLYCCASDGRLFWTELEGGRLPDTELTFESKQVSKASLDCVVAHPKIAHKVAILARDHGVYLVDMRLDDVERLDGIVKARQLTRAAYSPCGNLLLACCESGDVVAYGTIKRERLGAIQASDLGHSAPARDVSYHPGFHAIAVVSYQPGAMVQIWRFDASLAKAQQRPKVVVRPSTSIKADPSKPISDRATLPPLPNPVLSNNLTRIRTQFDTALDRMKILNQSTETLPSRNVSRNLFPSGLQRPATESVAPAAPELTSEPDLTQSTLLKSSLRSSTVRFNVEQQKKRLQEYESQIRQLSPAKQPEAKVYARPQLEQPIESESPKVQKEVEKEEENDENNNNNSASVVVDEQKPKKKRRKKKPKPPVPPPPQNTTATPPNGAQQPETVTAERTIESTAESIPTQSTLSYFDQLRSIASQ